MALVANSWVVGAICCCAGLIAHASPQPIRDIIDTCTYPVLSRSEITDELGSRGWVTLDEDYPDWIPNLLADGYLLWYLDVPPGNPSLNFLGVDKQTAALPDMAETMEEMIDASVKGLSGIMLADGPSNAVVFVHLFDDGDLGKTITCYLYGDDIAALDPIFTAFDMTIHDHFRREVGPTRVYGAIFDGKAPLPEPTGMHGLMVDYGLLPKRPISSPPIGAGPSSMTLRTYDASQFAEHYGRLPRAEYFVRTTTEPFNEVPQ